jgi:tRNA A-37 threonylcarbamoyl transferase component Bud32/ActR/RegA family two-component response regulator
MNGVESGAAEGPLPQLGSRAGRAARLFLIVNDDLEIRLKLAALLRKTELNVDADTIGRAGLDGLATERLRGYAAVLLIVEFAPATADSEPFSILHKIRSRAPQLPVFIFARGGDERCAAKAIKTGAADYWPIHAVDLHELRGALQPYSGADSAGASAAPGANPAPAIGWSPPQVAGYRVLKKIAHSSAATVYLASNDELAQPVALKVQAIKGSRSVSEADRQRFARECEILSSLNHRSIADVVDFGITDEYLFLALEYFPCGSLRERMKNPITEDEALAYARQIGEALQVVHSAGVIHRDLKPSNLMLTDHNRVVLIDFGSARAPLLAGSLTRSDLRTGTPYYMSPELIDGRDPDERGDLYGLGIVLFEMLAGTLPFRGNNLAEIFDGHRLGEVPRLPERARRHQAVIDRLLAKRPDDRYSTAAQFLESLGTAGTQITTSTHRAAQSGALDS